MSVGYDTPRAGYAHSPPIRATSKPIKSFIDGHFLPWFDKAPSHKHIEMLFVPFPQHHEQSEEKKLDFRTVASEKARLRENDYGVVIDRLRLTELMALSKVSGRYDKQEYELHEDYIRTWAAGALSYAEGKDAAA